MSQTTYEVTNPLNQYTMEKDRFMLIHMGKFDYRFKTIQEAKIFGINRCRGANNFYIIVDTEKGRVVDSWSY